MTEKRRNEMRNYREMAIAKEQLIAINRNCNGTLLDQTVKCTQGQRTVTTNCETDICKFLNEIDINSVHEHDAFSALSEDSRDVMLLTDDDPNILHSVQDSIQTDFTTSRDIMQIMDDDPDILPSVQGSTLQTNLSISDFDTTTEMPSFSECDTLDLSRLLNKRNSMPLDCLNSSYDDRVTHNNSTTSSTLTPEPLNSTAIFRPLEGIPRLIRSNSYTLDGPSPLFLKHLQSTGIDPPCKTTDKPTPKGIENKEPKKTKSLKKTASSTRPRKSSFEHVYSSKVHVRVNKNKNTGSITDLPKTITKVVSKAIAAKTNQIKATRNIYDPRPKQKTQIIVTAPSPSTPPLLKPSTPSSPPPPPLPASSPPPLTPARPHTVSTMRNDHLAENKIIDFITQIERDRKEQMDELMRRQEEEQRKMQDNFMRQQELLIKQITDNYCSNLLGNVQQVTPLKDSCDDLAAGNSTINNYLNLTTNRYLSMKCNTPMNESLTSMFISNDTKMLKSDSSDYSVCRQLFNEPPTHDQHNSNNEAIKASLFYFYRIRFNKILFLGSNKNKCMCSRLFGTKTF